MYRNSTLAAALLLGTMIVAPYAASAQTSPGVATPPTVNASNGGTSPAPQPSPPPAGIQPTQTIDFGVDLSAIKLPGSTGGTQTGANPGGGTGSAPTGAGAPPTVNASNGGTPPTPSPGAPPAGGRPPQNIDFGIDLSTIKLPGSTGGPTSGTQSGANPSGGTGTAPTGTGTTPTVPASNGGTSPTLPTGPLPAGGPAIQPKTLEMSPLHSLMGPQPEPGQLLLPGKLDAQKPVSNVNILFPDFRPSIQFDTGITIANTSQDLFETKKPVTPTVKPFFGGTLLTEPMPIDSEHSGNLGPSNTPVPNKFSAQEKATLSAPTRTPHLTAAKIDLKPKAFVIPTAAVETPAPKTIDLKNVTITAKPKAFEVMKVETKARTFDIKTIKVEAKAPAITVRPVVVAARTPIVSVVRIPTVNIRIPTVMVRR